MFTHETQRPSMRSLFMMTLEKYITDNIPRHATVLTFSALFAVAPILVLATKIMGLIYGPQIAEGQIRTQVEHFIDSPGVATLVQTLLDNTLPAAASWWIIAGFSVVLLYCLSSFFVELKVVLNHIWGIPISQDDGIWEYINARIQGAFMGLLGGLLLFCGFFITTQVTLMTEWLLYNLNLGIGYGEWSYVFLLFAMLTGLFVLTYQFVPNVKIVWQNVLLGAIATAFLFSVSRLLLLQYFSYSYLNTMFGAASAAVIILLWAYYSMSVFLLGAEFTYIHSQTYGRWWREMEPSRAEDGAREEQDVIKRNVAHQIFATNQSQILIKKPLSAAFSTPEQIEFLEEFAQLAMLPTIAKVSESGVTGLVDVVEKKSWLARMIKREKKSQPIVATDTIVADATIADEEEPKRRFFRPLSRPLARKRKAQPKEVSASTGRLNPIAKARQHAQTIRRRTVQILSFPIRVIRPVREVVLAVGVIGAISIAAVIGLPLWRKKEVVGDAGLEPSGSDS